MDTQTQDTSTTHIDNQTDEWKCYKKGGKVKLVNPPKPFAKFKYYTATIVSITHAKVRGLPVYFYLKLDDQEMQDEVTKINRKIRKNPQSNMDNQHPENLIKVSMQGIENYSSSFDRLVSAALNSPFESQRVDAQAVDAQAVDAQAVEAPPAEAVAPTDTPKSVVEPVFESTRTERNLRARLDLTDRMCAWSDRKNNKKKVARADTGREKTDLIGRKIEKVFYDRKRKRKVYQGVVTSMSRAKGRQIYVNGCKTVYRVEYPAVGNEPPDSEDMSRADVLKHLVA